MLFDDQVRPELVEAERKGWVLGMIPLTRVVPSAEQAMGPQAAAGAAVGAHVAPELVEISIPPVQAATNV